MRTSLRSGTIYLTIGSILFMLSSYAINVWLARSFGPDLYGFYGVIISLITLINVTQTAGLPQAVSKFIAANEEESEAVYNTGFIVQLVSTSLVSMFFYFKSDSIAYLLKDYRLVPYLQFSALIFPVYGLYAFLAGYYNGLHYFKKQGVLHIVYSLLKIISIIFFGFFYNLYGVLIGFIVSPLFTLLMGIHIPKKNGIYFSYTKLIYFSIPLIIISVFSNLLQSTDLFFVKSLLQSDKYAGLYAANQNIARIPLFAVMSFNSILFPSISRSVGLKLHTETKELIAKSIRYSLILVIPFVVILASTSSQILLLIYSPEYLAGSDSLSILMIGVGGFLTLFMILTTIISGSDAPWVSTFLSGIGIVISAVLCVSLIPQFGINGAAAATTISTLIILLAAKLYIFRKFNVFVSITSIFKIIFASTLIYLIAKMIVVPILFLPAFYLFLLSFYFLVLLFLKEIKKEDFQLIKAFMPEKLNRLNS